MILHKLIDGPEAGQYLPFGLSRLRALEKIYGSAGFFQEKFRVGSVEIYIKQEPPFQYLTIRGVDGSSGIILKHEPYGSGADQAVIALDTNPPSKYRRYQLVDAAWNGYAVKNFRKLSIPLVDAPRDLPDPVPVIDERIAENINTSYYSKFRGVHACIGNDFTTVYLGGAPVLTTSDVVLAGVGLYRTFLYVAYTVVDLGVTYLCVQSHLITALGYNQTFVVADRETIPHITLPTDSEVLATFHPFLVKATWLSNALTTSGTQTLLEYKLGSFVAEGDIEDQLTIDEAGASVAVADAGNQAVSGSGSSTSVYTATLEQTTTETPPRYVLSYKYEEDFSYSYTMAGVRTTSVSGLPIYTGYNKNGARVIWRVSGSSSAVVTGTYSNTTSYDQQSIKFSRDELTPAVWTTVQHDDGSVEGAGAGTLPTYVSTASFDLQIGVFDSDGIERAGAVIELQRYHVRSPAPGGDPDTYGEHRLLFAPHGSQYVALHQRYLTQQVGFPDVNTTWTTSFTLPDGTTGTDSGSKSSSVGGAGDTFGSHTGGHDAPLHYTSVSGGITGADLYNVELNVPLGYESAFNERGATIYASGSPTGAAVIDGGAPQRTLSGTLPLTTFSVGNIAAWGTDVHSFPDIDTSVYVYTALPARLAGTATSSFTSSGSYFLQAEPVPRYFDLRFSVLYNEPANKHCLSPHPWESLAIGQAPGGANEGRTHKVYLLGSSVKDITPDILTAKRDPDHTAILPQSPGSFPNDPDDTFIPLGLI